MTIKEYVKSINSRHQLGQSTENSFRGDLQFLIESPFPGIMAINQPKSGLKNHKGRQLKFVDILHY